MFAPRSDRLVLVALSLVSLAGLGCHEQVPQIWTRAVYHQDQDDRRYTIVQADPETDTCVRIILRAGEPWTPDHGAGVDVEWRGLSGFFFSEATIERPYPDYPEFVISRDCTTTEIQTDVGPPPPQVRGTLEFSDFVNREDPSRPCSVSFELEITPWAFPGDPVPAKETIQAEAAAITDAGCPHPDSVALTLTELDAAYGEVDGLGTVVIAGWDPALAVCVWGRLLASGEAVSSASAVEVPAPWVYSGLRVADLAPEACVASQLLDPNRIDVDANASVSAGPLRSAGEVTFVETISKQTGAGTMIEAPCVLDLEVQLQSYGEYYWVPNTVTMTARQIAVAGACG